MTEAKFYICRVCGNIVGLVHAGGGPLSCCGQPMEALVPNTTEAAQEKHVPVISQDGAAVTVKVGSAAHPMTEAHLIQWIYLETKQGGQRKKLYAGDAPEAVFAMAPGDAPVAAYAYCNLHGLWKADI